MAADPRAQAWAALAAHRQGLGAFSLREAFRVDPGRAERHTLSVGSVTLDASKHLVTDETVRLLLDLVAACNVPERFAAMLRGEKINATEGRAVLHTALRRSAAKPLLLDGHDVMQDVEAVRVRMRAFATAVRNGDALGVSGQTFTDVVNIGIGGSDLGPAMATQALALPGRGPRVHYLSNVDGHAVEALLPGLDPARTLVIVASKTFTTQETLTNAHTVRAWLVEALGEAAVAKHVAALSTNLDAVRAFGIEEQAMFPFWDWVGGRFSLWSAVGLSTMMAIGPAAFDAMLKGASVMDTHMAEAPLAANLPVRMAVLGAWYGRFWGARAHAVLPYDQRLARFPAFLQQLEMESNGKSVRMDGTAVDGPTAAVLFGEPGTNSQHSFYQLLHQGTDVIPADVIVVARPDHPHADHHAKLLSHALAQTEAWMMGRTAAEARAAMLAAGMDEAKAARLAPHRAFPGNRPSSTLVLDDLAPDNLGMLVALYEHKTFVQSVLWDINAFDQWGVELGKQLAGTLLPELTGKAVPGAHDASTALLRDRLRSLWPKGLG